MSQSTIKRTLPAAVDPTYVTQVADSTLTNEQALSALSTGYAKVTTSTGVVTSQAVPIPRGDGGTGATSFNSNGLVYGTATAYANTAEGATGTVLFGVTGDVPTFRAVNLASADVTGILPVANGGTNQSAAFTAGSLVFSDGTRFEQDNANLFWDNTSGTEALYTGGTTLATADISLSKNGAAVFNEQGTGSVTKLLKVESDTNDNAFVASHVGVSSVSFLGSTAVAPFEFYNSFQVFNEQGGDVDFRIEGDTETHLLFCDASADKVGIRNSTPNCSLSVNGGIVAITRNVTSNYTLTEDDYFLRVDVSGAPRTITLPSAVVGRKYIIHAINAGAINSVTISAALGQTIEGGASRTLAAPHTNYTLIADTTSSWVTQGNN